MEADALLDSSALKHSGGVHRAVMTSNTQPAAVAFSGPPSQFLCLDSEVDDGVVAPGRCRRLFSINIPITRTAKTVPRKRKQTSLNGWILRRRFENTFAGGFGWKLIWWASVPFWWPSLNGSMEAKWNSRNLERGKAEIRCLVPQSETDFGIINLLIAATSYLPWGKIVDILFKYLGCLPIRSIVRDNIRNNQRISVIIVHGPCRDASTHVPNHLR